MIERTFNIGLLLLLIASASCVIITKLSEEQIQILKRSSVLATYSEKFHVLNLTFACNKTNDVITKSMIKKLLGQDKEILVRRVSELAKEDMQDMLRFKGGTFMPEYLATDEASAANFPDAMTMRFRRRPDGAPGGLINNWMDPRSRVQSSRSDNPFGRPPKKGQPNSPGSKPQKVQDKIRGRNRRRRQVNDSKRHKRQASDSLFPSDDLTTLSTVRRDVTCSAAGEPSEYDPNYLHLCKICSAKRLLLPDRYPRVINEVFCLSTEDGCLGNGNGKCVPTIFNVHILKRKDDTCQLCIKDSELQSINEWEIYVEPIRVGCECMLNKNSYYRQTWFKSNSTGLPPVG